MSTSLLLPRRGKVVWLLNAAHMKAVAKAMLTAKRCHRLVRLAVRVPADNKFDLGPITEAYDIELPAGDDEAAEVFTAVAHRMHEKYRTVGRALSGGAETIQMLPVSPPAAEA